MPTDPYPGTPAPNTLADATKLRGQLDALFIPVNPNCRVYHSATQAVGTGLFVPLVFNSERFDTDTIHDTATNTGRLTCKTAGVYLIAVTFSWEGPASPSGYREARIRLNGATDIAVDSRLAVTTASTPTHQAVSTIYKLAVNDYVEVGVQHNQGASLNINATGNHSPEFQIAFLGT